MKLDGKVRTMDLAKFPSENPNPVLRVAKNGVLLYANDACHSLLAEWNCQKDEIMPESWRQTVSEVFATGLSKTLEIGHADRTFAFMVVPVLDAGYANLYARDITEHKQAENALHDSEQRLRLVTDSSNDYILMLDTNLDIQFINRTEAGLDRKDMIGTPLYQYVDGHNKERVKNILQEVVNENEARRYDTTFNRPDGTVVYFETIASPIQSEGKVAGVAVTSRDITERKAVESALQAKTYDLGERVKELDCLYGLSRLIDKHDSLEAIFNGLVEIIPPSWQYPKTTCCRIIALGSEFNSSGFEQTEWQQSCEIIVNDYHTGSIEVFYKQPFPEEDEGPFLKEERDLINALAARLSRVIERKQAENELQEAHAGLETRVQDRTKELAQTVDVLQDEIKQRMEIQEALQRSEGKYRELNVKLETQATQLRELNRQLIQAEQGERKRLAKILHDHLQQMLVGAKLNIAVLARKSKEASFCDSLNEVNSLLSDCIDASKSLTVELCPPVLHEGGFIDAIKWLVRRFEKEFQLAVVLDADRDCDHIEQDCRIFLFEAVRELLFNVVKHAKSNTAKIKIICLADNQVKLVIEDEGVGFDTEQHQNRDNLDGGFGLFSVREHAAVIGGTLDIRSRPGKGTRATLSVPLSSFD